MDIHYTQHRVGNLRKMVSGHMADIAALTHQATDLLEINPTQNIYDSMKSILEDLGVLRNAVNTNEALTDNLREPLLAHVDSLVDLVDEIWLSTM